MKRAFPIWFLFLMALVASAAAQSLDLTRARVPGGGGVSAGGQFTLFSTVGQPEAGPRLAGGGLTLDTGFLSATLPSPIPTIYFPQGTVTVLEDSGAQTRVTYATFEPGDAGPPALPATFHLSHNNVGLFNVAPAIATDRTLTFTPAANASGTAVVTVVVRADGVDVATNSFAIVVTAVNDAPAVTLAGNATVLEDAGAQTVSSFAAFAAGPSDEAAQTPTYTLTADNAALFSVQPALAANGTLTYTPAANANGSATITVVTADGGGTDNGGVDRTTNTFTIAVTAVNDAPALALATNHVVLLEDAGAQTLTGFAVFTAGPADESAQTPAYTLTADNAALFSVQPTLAANGILTFTPAANANGSATVTVVTMDNGGSDSGGMDRSTNSFTITVTAVNDAPSLAFSANPVVVALDLGPQTIAGFATFNPGPSDEAAQTPAYTLTTDNAALFSAPPAIAANGTLTFTTTTGVGGAATVTVVVQDTGGIANGGVDKATNTFTLSVLSFAAVADRYSVAEDGTLAVAAGAGVLTNDIGSGLQAVLAAAATNGALTLNSDGSFTYRPATNFNGTDTFAYYVTNSTDTSAVVTVSLTVTVVNDAPGVVPAQSIVTVLEDAGAQSLVGFVTFSVGPANESAQGLDTDVGYVVINDNLGLFSTQPAVATDGTLTFSPAADANGSATVTLIAQDTGGTTSGGVNRTTNTFTIVVSPVNDAPGVSFATNEVVVLEDAGAQTVAGFAAFAAGPANEVAQTLVGYTVSNSSNVLFSVQPAINNAGVLTFMPAAHANGSATVTVVVQDSGGTADGGVDKATNTFLVTLRPVNDAPGVAYLTNEVVVLEDAGAQSMAGFAAFTAGPANEVAQMLVGYTVSNSSNALFFVQPTITSAGVLTFTPATNANGSATVTVVSQDSGGTTGGGADKTTNTFTITVTPVNDAPSFILPTGETVAGMVIAWGDNSYDQTTVPIRAQSGVTAIAAGRGHNVALKHGGSVVAWGFNGHGQTTIPSSAQSGVTAIAAGGNHTMVLRNDGSVVAWGSNSARQSNVPTNLGGVIAIAAGGDYSVALKGTGEVVAWGDTRNRHTVPASAQSGVTSIATGGHTVALKDDGSVVAWGLNAFGETTIPVAAQSLVVAVAAGNFHSVALKNNGSVVAWGYNGSGQTTIPVAAQSSVIAVAAGGHHTAALKTDGSVLAWGYNSSGQTTIPVAARSRVTAIAAAANHTVALLSEGVNPPVVIVREDSGAYSKDTNFVTSIFAGPADESTQAVSFVLTTDNPSLFSAQPAIAPNGTLTFIPAAHANGTASVSVVAKDNGGTANGGVDTSTPQTFVITVTPVNDAPSASLAQGTVTVLEDAGAQTRNAFAAFSPGPPNESAQTLVGYTVTLNNAALFSAAPAINNMGVLTFTPAANANGSATVTVVVQDDGGTAGGGVDKNTNTFTIVVAAVNDTPVANNDTYTVNQGDALTVAAAGVLANDTDVENNALTATRLTNPAHGTISFSANGGFTYTPDTNFYGVDSFTYRASDASSNSTPATVSLSVLARPVITPPPGKQRVFSSAALRFSVTNAPDINAIRVSDPDSTALTLTLTVTNGTLAVTVTNGLTLPNGSTNTNSLVLAGLITDLNAALESLAYFSVTNYFGDDALVLVAQDEGGRTNRGNGVFDIQVEIPARGAALDVSLNGYNNPGVGRMVTNATAVTLDTNLVQVITYDPTNNVVRVQPVGGQDGATNRSSVTVLARYSDGTTELITVPVIIYNPLLTTTTNNNVYDATFAAPLFNLQTSLYEQKVRVQNNTPFDFTALRITATNLPATVTLQNATLTNGGLPYIDYNLPVFAGSNVTLKLEYFSSDLLPFTPGLKLELLNQQRTNAAPTNTTMSAISARRGFSPDGANKNYLKFPTELGRLYYVQYQDVAGPVWKTSPVVLRGTGFVLNWMDDGPPNTETPPGSARFYRVVTER